MGNGTVALNVIGSGSFQTYTPTELFARTGAPPDVSNCGTVSAHLRSEGSLSWESRTPSETDGALSRIPMHDVNNESARTYRWIRFGEVARLVE